MSDTKYNLAIFWDNGVSSDTKDLHTISITFQKKDISFRLASPKTIQYLTSSAASAWLMANAIALAILPRWKFIFRSMISSRRLATRPKLPLGICPRCRSRCSSSEEFAISSISP
jgi:hypothetical protein